MSRLLRAQAAKPPAYQYHISGSARVTIAYSDYFLGPYGSRESRKLYALLIAEYEKLGEAPDKEWFKGKKAKLERKRLRKEAKRDPSKEIVTVAAVTALLRKRIEEIYASQSVERRA